MINVDNLTDEAKEALSHRFSPDMKPRPEDALIFFNFGNRKVDILGRGEFISIMGKTGVGKSIFLEALIGASIRGELGIIETNGVKNILHIDTEQSKNQWIYANYRIQKYAGMEIPDTYTSLSLKGYRNLTKLQITDQIIKEYENLDLIVIDGAADFMKNINNEEASVDILDTIQIWADTKQAGIVCVVHETKGKEHTFMKGHLGSYLDQKGTSTIRVHKEIDSSELFIEPTKVRNKYWHEHSFYINDMKMIDFGMTEPSGVVHGARHLTEDVSSILADLTSEEI